MQAAIATMVGQSGGVIINLASMAAVAGISDRFAYSMSKGAVRAMTLSVAKTSWTRIFAAIASPRREYILRLSMDT